ncbi:MAG TPA: cyclic nucleotide-binding domain-containing protein [Anaerolineales bacterium]|nr:cyclic nucleotide-binding domain-containing protein [Anaerolineales bacterium]
MLRSFTKLFSIAPGEERKTALLFSLHLLFYLGLMLGDSASYSLFISNWSAEDLAAVIMTYAVMGFLIGLAYTFVADRISNGRLLNIIMGTMLVWLLSVQVMMNIYSGTRGFVFFYFYLAYRAFSDLSTMHILIYINDFYDTRSAKRALPLLLSAGAAGGILAGFATTPIKNLGALEYTPSIWAICLVGCFTLVMTIQRQLPGDVGEIERRRRETLAKNKVQQGGFQNLRDGFDYVRKSGLLRALTIATFTMVILMTMLQFQFSKVFSEHYTREELFVFNGYLTSVSNVGVMLIQAFVLSRLIRGLGVGTMNLVFPVMTLGSVVAVKAGANFPAAGLPTAVFARMDTTMLKQAFRNPLDAMIYNSVPIKNKARARGFINGAIVPLGTLSAGLIVQAVKAEVFSDLTIFWIGLGASILYILIMFTVRREYAKSMTSLLAGDELAILKQDPSEVVPTDPATVNWLYEKLHSLPGDTSADGQAIFISQILYDMDSNSALPLMLEMAKRRSPFFRKGMIELLDQGGVTSVDFIRLCQQSLEDPESMVRESATTALLGYLQSAGMERSAIISEESILNNLYLRLGELSLNGQAQLIIQILRSGSPGQKSSVRKILESWLSAIDLDENKETDLNVLDAGLLVLSETERQGLIAKMSPANSEELRYLSNTQPSRFKDLTGRMLTHPNSAIRRQVIHSLARESHAARWMNNHWSVLHLQRLLDDSEESVRMAVLEALYDDIQIMPLKPLLWKALNDPSLEVRKAVCNLPLRLERAEISALWDCLTASDVEENPNRAESAIYLLRRSDQTGVTSTLSRMAESLIYDAYWMALPGIALHDQAQTDATSRTGLLLLANALREDSLLVVEEVLWLISASTSEDEVQAVRQSLSSNEATERANAAEALEANLPPATARQLRYLLDGSDNERIKDIALEEFDLQQPTVDQVLHITWPQLITESADIPIPNRLQKFFSDSWLTMASIHLMLETYRIGRLESDTSIPLQDLREALETTLRTEPRANIRETARHSLDELITSAKEKNMSTETHLTLIEKVIFLKEVPFFSDLPFREISILAEISEEVSFPAEHKIFSQGDMTRSLYLIIKGRVSVQQQQPGTGSVTRLATLGAKNYFAETSIFDGAPHQADIMTIDPVDILLIRQSTLFTLVRKRPDLGLSLLKALSQRLRETYAQVAHSERAKPQKLVSLFDKLEGSN